MPLGTGGSGWIRTTEAKKQQIYSLPPLATREHSLILSFRYRKRSCRCGSHYIKNAETRTLTVLPPRLLPGQVGAGGRIRTPDLLITNQLLYQLSYTSEMRHNSLKLLDYYITDEPVCQEKNAHFFIFIDFLRKPCHTQREKAAK